jgi:pilus assembly protein Flp/PilA
MNKLFITLVVMTQSLPERLKNEDRGATAVEYGLLVGLIAVVLIAAVTGLGTKLKDLFTSITGSL